jgi:hypothetical protein
MRREISNQDDLIDSRDIIARITELEETEERDEDEQAELEALTALQDEAEDCCTDWRHGETLIRDSYFRRYAEQYADDIGAINGDAHWPNCCIDWERAARELQQDFSSAEFDGVTYWVRG